jgi:hypothetical protein
MRIVAAVVIVALLTGCTPVNLDPVMGRTTGTPTTEPQKLDCDLIFPPASVLP